MATTKSIRHVCAGALAAFLAATAVSAQEADIVFTNAQVYTMNSAGPTGEAVAVTGNEITFVGSAEEVEAVIGADTEVFDLDGKMVLPGFVSGHDHLVASKWASFGVDLFPAATVEEALVLIKDYAEANPDEKVILGYGWNRTTFGEWPTAAQLDELLPDRPAFLLDFTIHDAWMNSAAFEAGGCPPTWKTRSLA